MLKDGGPDAVTVYFSDGVLQQGVGNNPKFHGHIEVILKFKGDDIFDALLLEAYNLLDELSEERPYLNKVQIEAGQQGDGTMVAVLKIPCSYTIQPAETSSQISSVKISGTTIAHANQTERG